MPATAHVDATTDMSLAVASNWRLGSDRDPGWFDVGDLDNINTEFSMSTVFKLNWQSVDPTKDQIHNLLHSITLGWSNKTSKIHIEQLAQILHGELHITSRFSDHAGRVHRNTQPLPGGLMNIGKWLRLDYSGFLENNIFSTVAEICNYNTGASVQQCSYKAAVNSTDFNFYTWNSNRVTCNYEQFGVPCNHVMIHGHTTSPDVAQFDIQQVRGSIGNTANIWYCAGPAKQQTAVKYRYSNANVQEITVTPV
jgi:hypothetical protein